MIYRPYFESATKEFFSQHVIIIPEVKEGEPVQFEIGIGDEDNEVEELELTFSLVELLGVSEPNPFEYDP